MGGEIIITEEIAQALGDIANAGTEDMRGLSLIAKMVPRQVEQFIQDVPFNTDPLRELLDGYRSEINRHLDVREAREEVFDRQAAFDEYWNDVIKPKDYFSD